MSRPSTFVRRRRALIRRRLIGAAALAAPVWLVWLSVAVYHHAFTPTDTITVVTDSAGNNLRVHADVKLRGVVVGQVASVASDGTGARLTLAVSPDRLRLIPADVVVELLPTTLFGERYVAFVPPARPSPIRLAPNSVVAQDRSHDAVELTQAFDSMLPLLTTVQPEKLASTLSAVSQALSGRGTQLGADLVHLDSYLEQLNPQLPAFDDDLAQLVKVAQAYTTAAPDLLDALSDLTKTSATIAGQRANLASTFSSATGAIQDFTAFLKQNSTTIIRLSDDSEPTLKLFAEYSPEFGCTLRTLADFVPKMDRALGKGTNQPGLHVDVHTVPSLGKYVPGRDAPVYKASGGPRCPGGSYGAAVSGDSVTVVPGGLGLADSPAENQLVTELIAPALGTSASALPDWTNLLAGPVYRGAEVTVS